jgi:hypothetical protein
MDRDRVIRKLVRAAKNAMKQPEFCAMRTTNESVFPHPPASHSGSERHEEDFMTGEMIAGKLNETTEWVNSRCRRRSSNPMPFHNAGSRRFFLYSEVHAWIMNSPKVVHSRHRRRTKTEVAAAQNVKKKKEEAA